MAWTSQQVSYRVGSEKICGSLYLPERKGTGLFPCVLLGHGWGMVAGGDLEDYAKAIVARGIAALTFDYRNLGKSEGLPRQHLDPNRQIEDFRAAVSFVRSLSEIDGTRIGIWGSSYGGGHALSVAAMDPRIACVVSQVPTISGWRTAKGRMTPEAWDEQWKALIADRERVFTGAEGAIQKTVSADPAERVSYPDRASHDYMTAQGKRCPEWKNFTTLASIELARHYEPGAFLYRITRTPVLMIIATQDITTPHQLQREAFAALRTTKKLLEVDGGHYTVYQEHFDQTSKAAADWFEEHLG
jgi:fermentation-respiration switch protein FrsA (DUF1100 family)